MKKFLLSKTISNVKKSKLILYILILLLTPVTIWLSDNKWASFVSGMLFTVIGYEAVKLYDHSQEE